MSHSPVPSLVLAAALSACVLEPELLNSQRIEERFGNYGIEVLSQDGKLRRSNLYSTHAGIRTCRTYAVVQFMDSPPREIQASHQAVLAGQSLGSTFREAGWTIGKHSLFVGGFSLTKPDGEIARLMSVHHGCKVLAITEAASVIELREAMDEIAERLSSIMAMSCEVITTS